MNLSPHFTEGEFRCQCPCRIVNVDPTLIVGLEHVRDLISQPILILSGCRCPEHNKAVGGEPNSQHITTPEKPGRAADIRVNGIPAMRLYDYFLSKIPQFRGFGVDLEKNFVHVDVRLVPARWTYHNGKQVPWIAASGDHSLEVIA